MLNYHTSMCYIRLNPTKTKRKTRKPREVNPNAKVPNDGTFQRQCKRKRWLSKFVKLPPWQAVPVCQRLPFSFFIAYANVFPAAKKLVSAYRRIVTLLDVPPCRWNTHINPWKNWCRKTRSHGWDSERCTPIALTCSRPIQNQP